MPETITENMSETTPERTPKNIDSLCRLADNLEFICGCLEESKGEYVTFEEAVAIASIIRRTSFNGILEACVQLAERSAQILLTDAHTTMMAVERYRETPCKVDFRYVYRKHLCAIEKELKEAERLAKHYLQKIEDEYYDSFGISRGPLDVFPTPRLRELHDNYIKECERSAQCRFDLVSAKSRLQFMDSTSPEVIDLYFDKAGEIAKGIVDDLARQGIIWKKFEGQN